MSKFTKLDPVNQEVIEKVIAELLLDQVLNITLRSDNTLKTVIESYKETARTTEISTGVGDIIGPSVGGGVEFTIVVNEDYFDQMPDEFQRMAILETLHPLGKSETGAATKKKADVVTYSDFIAKYSMKDYIRYMESVKSVIDKVDNAGKPNEPIDKRQGVLKGFEVTMSPVKVVDDDTE